MEIYQNGVLIPDPAPAAPMVPAAEPGLGAQFMQYVPTNKMLRGNGDALAFAAKLGTNVMNANSPAIFNGKEWVQTPNTGTALVNGLNQVAQGFQLEDARKKTVALAPAPAPVAPAPPVVAPAASVAPPPSDASVQGNGKVAALNAGVSHANFTPAAQVSNVEGSTTVSPSFQPVAADTIAPPTGVMQVPPTVAQDQLTKSLIAGPSRAADPYVGVNSISDFAAANMGPEQMAGYTKMATDVATTRNLLDKEANDAYKNTVEAYKAQGVPAKNAAETQQAIATAWEKMNPGYVEKQKIIGKGEGELVKWAQQCAIGDTQPIASPAIKKLFPGAKTMGDVYKNLGPEAAKTIGDLLQLQGSYANAAALEKTLYPTLATAYAREMDDLNKTINPLLSLAIATPNMTVGQKVMVQVGEGKKGFLSDAQAAQLSAAQERLAVVSSYNNDLTGAMSGVLKINRSPGQAKKDNAQKKVDAPAADSKAPKTILESAPPTGKASVVKIDGNWAIKATDGKYYKPTKVQVDMWEKQLGGKK